MALADKINAALDDGKTITVATYLRVVRVNAKHRKMWQDAGHEFFKTDGTGAPVMIDGQKQGKPRYVCISGAKVSAA